MKDQCVALPKPKPALFLSGLFPASLFSSPVVADNWADGINLTGFMSAKYQKINKDNFFNGDDYSGIGKDGSFRDTMHNTPMPVMEGLNHTTVALGMRVNWSSIIGYAEWADTDMETEIMNGSSWYTTWGYQMGDWLPHLTYQYFERGEESTSPQEQNMTTAGLRYDLSDVADLKFEYSIINTEKGQGLFENAPVDDSTNRFGIAIDFVF